MYTEMEKKMETTTLFGGNRPKRLPMPENQMEKNTRYYMKTAHIFRLIGIILNNCRYAI